MSNSQAVLFVIFLCIVSLLNRDEYCEKYDEKHVQQQQNHCRKWHAVRVSAPHTISVLSKLSAYKYTGAFSSAERSDRGCASPILLWSSQSSKKLLYNSLSTHLNSVCAYAYLWSIICNAIIFEIKLIEWKINVGHPQMSIMSPQITKYMILLDSPGPSLAWVQWVHLHPRFLRNLMIIFFLTFRLSHKNE